MISAHGDTAFDMAVNDSPQRQDPRELPCYGIAEAAHYLGIPAATLRSWVRGRSYPYKGGMRQSEALISLPDPGSPTLSFLNLVEAHVLKAIRRRHGVSMGQVRRALDWLEHELPQPHPLATHRFATDGVRLFVEAFGQIVDLSSGAQVVISEVLARYLERVEHDAAGMAARLFPFTRRDETRDPRLIVIDARLAFGRPVIRGTGVPTQIIVERYKAGDSISVLAQDYERPLEEIEEAIRCEIELPVAA